MPYTDPLARPHLEALTVADLRREAAARGVGTGTWRAGASKADLVEALITGIIPAAPSPEPVSGDALSQAIAAAVAPYIKTQAPPLDENAVRAIVRAEIGDRREITVLAPSGARVDLGRQHEKFPTLLKFAEQRQAVWLVGPAASGKTTAAEKVAAALGLRFFCVSVCRQSTKSDLLGYMSGPGTYIPGVMREPYENGGIFLLDEGDRGSENVLNCLNAALANGYCSFPDRMVSRHPDFVVIAAGNTFGTGADRIYVGAAQLDGAFLDRFAKLVWPYDEPFETELAGDAAWSSYVQKVRAAVDHLKIRRVVSPRASINGARMLAAGIDRETVEAAFIFDGWSPDELQKVKGAL